MHNNPLTWGDKIFSELAIWEVMTNNQNTIFRASYIETCRHGTIHVFKGLKNRIQDSTKSLNHLFNKELRSGERPHNGLISLFLKDSEIFK